MAFERLMGLNVINNEDYQKYREGMEPILKSHGGSFGYDFKIAEVLRSKTDGPINRVFTIEFPSEDIMEKFFSNTDYLEVQKKYFEASVGNRTTIAMYEKANT